jgi:hypothetical protein
MKKYIEPQIADYGSIAEMTAGKSYHQSADAIHVVGANLEHESTGLCYGGTPPGPGNICTKP